jgi:hypothetical protein
MQWSQQSLKSAILLLKSYDFFLEGLFLTWFWIKLEYLIQKIVLKGLINTGKPNACDKIRGTLMYNNLKFNCSKLFRVEVIESQTTKK